MSEINAKEVLKRKESRNEWLARASGALVVFGLILEICWSPDLHLIIANGIIAVGVIGEVYFAAMALKASGELRAALELDAAQPIERAEKARLETEKLRAALVWRRLPEAPGLFKLAGEL